MQLGDSIIWTNDLSVPEVREGTVTKLGKDICWVDNQHKPEDCIYQAFTWPSRVKVELLAIMSERQRLKSDYDNSMAMVYQLQNKIARGDI